jgi:hypothetical protein
VVHLEPSSSFGTLNEDFQSYHADYFFNGIVGVTSLDPTLVPLVQAWASLPDVVFGAEHSC